MRAITQNELQESASHTHRVVTRCAENHIHQHREEGHVDADYRRQVAQQRIAHALRNLHDRHRAAAD